MKKQKSHLNQKEDHDKIYAMQGSCFGVTSYRGFAPLSVLSRMSMPDEYHQINNPNGTQRDLKPKHAQEAYNYAKKNYNAKDALWPEIILNIRDKSVLTITPKSLAKGPRDSNLTFVKISIDWNKIEKAKAKESDRISISRVDGNHRLYFANGDKRRKLEPLNQVYSPFCITEHVSLEAERTIFKDINSEQKRLNVAHLLRIETQLTPDGELWSKNKPLWIVVKLNEDNSSPFFSEVDKGGKKGKGESYLIKQKSLMDGIFQLLKNFPRYINVPQLLLLKAVINYFCAVKETWSNEWDNKKEYKLMTNTGMQALGIVGGRLMETLIITNRLIKDDFKEKLNFVSRESRDFWHVKSSYMEGKSGRPGAQKIADDMYGLISDIDSSKIEV